MLATITKMILLTSVTFFRDDRQGKGEIGSPNLQNKVYDPYNMKKDIYSRGPSI